MFKSLCNCSKGISVREPLSWWLYAIGGGEAPLCYSRESEAVKEMHERDEWEAPGQGLKSTTHGQLGTDRRILPVCQRE